MTELLNWTEFYSWGLHPHHLITSQRPHSRTSLWWYDLNICTFGGGHKPSVNNNCPCGMLNISTSWAMKYWINQWWTCGFWPVDSDHHLLFLKAPATLFPQLVRCPIIAWGFPVGSVEKDLLVSAGDTVSTSRSRRSPRGGLDNPLQYSCLKNPVDRRAWWATVHGVTKSQTHLSDWACTLACYCTSPITALLTLNCFCKLFVSPWEQNTNLLYFFFQNLIQSLAQSRYLLFVR